MKKILIKIILAVIIFFLSYIGILYANYGMYMDETKIQYIFDKMDLNKIEAGDSIIARYYVGGEKKYGSILVCLSYNEEYVKLGGTDYVYLDEDLDSYAWNYQDGLFWVTHDGGIIEEKRISDEEFKNEIYSLDFDFSLCEKPLITMKNLSLDSKQNNLVYTYNFVEDYECRFAFPRFDVEEKISISKLVIETDLAYKPTSICFYGESNKEKVILSYYVS